MKTEPPNVVVIECEGCSTRVDQVVTDRRKRYPLPEDWMETGRSRKRPGDLAKWCQRCRASHGYVQWRNPTAAEVRQLLAEKDERGKTKSA